MSLALPPVVLVDTSVLCELLRVPKLCNDPTAHEETLRRYAEEGATLLLPMATLIETGNHIAQNGDPPQRRRIAESFAGLVKSALTGQAKPFTTASFPDEQTLRRWLDIFPDHASRSERNRKGIGLGDVSILDEYHKQCELSPRRPIRIWSLDHALRRERNPS